MKILDILKSLLVLEDLQKMWRSCRNDSCLAINFLMCFCSDVYFFFLYPSYHLSQPGLKWTDLIEKLMVMFPVIWIHGFRLVFEFLTVLILFSLKAALKKIPKIYKYGMQHVEGEKNAVARNVQTLYHVEFYIYYIDLVFHKLHLYASKCLFVITCTSIATFISCLFQIVSFFYWSRGRGFPWKHLVLLAGSISSYVLLSTSMDHLQSQVNTLG